MLLDTPDPRRPTISTRELVGMVGVMMALNALSIDILLPALSEIAASYSVTGNAAQLVVTAYVAGFGLAQLVYGPASDAYGRRAILMVSLVSYAFATLLALFSQGFEMLLAARFMQGLAAAGTRVAAVALIRDLVSGRRMAEMMSFVMTVFMIAPVIAPSLGQLIMAAGPWRWIFAALLALGLCLLAWMRARLPETLPEARRTPLSFASAARSYWLALRHRVTLGYMTAAMFIFGSLFAFIATTEQIISEIYDAGEWFWLAFGGVALGLAAANILNARIARRLGPRRVSHAALSAFIAVNAGMALAAAFWNGLAFWVYYPLIALAMMLFGMIGANFTALAMEPAGERAGVTAALYGALTALSGAVLGSFIGQLYDGSVTPILAGQAGLGALALAVVFLTEHGRLFRASPEGEAEGLAARAD